MVVMQISTLTLEEILAAGVTSIGATIMKGDKSIKIWMNKYAFAKFKEGTKKGYIRISSQALVANPVIIFFFYKWTQEENKPFVFIMRKTKSTRKTKLKKIYYDVGYNTIDYKSEEINSTKLIKDAIIYTFDNEQDAIVCAEKIAHHTAILQ